MPTAHKHVALIAKGAGKQSSSAHTDIYNLNITPSIIDHDTHRGSAQCPASCFGFADCRRACHPAAFQCSRSPAHPPRRCSWRRDSRPGTRNPMPHAPASDQPLAFALQHQQRCACMRIQMHDTRRTSLCAHHRAHTNRRRPPSAVCLANTRELPPAATRAKYLLQTSTHTYPSHRRCA